jgi:phosphate transport system protein
MDRSHTDNEYENELTELRRLVLQMATIVEGSLERAITAFEQGDADLARELIAADRDVDELETWIDEACLLILAKRQPVASDLRFVTTALKVVTDLERMGDLVVNVCERVTELGENTERLASARAGVSRAAGLCRAMLHDAAEAFAARDAARAEAVVQRDDEVDTWYAEFFTELVQVMRDDKHHVETATELQSIAKYLERFADHSVSLAGMVIFMVRGDDVRHRGLNLPK